MPQHETAEALAALVASMGLSGLTIFWSGTKWQVSRNAKTSSASAWECFIHEDLATAIAECLKLPQPRQEDDDLAALFGRRKKKR